MKDVKNALRTLIVSVLEWYKRFYHESVGYLLLRTLHLYLNVYPFHITPQDVQCISVNPISLLGINSLINCRETPM